MARLLAGRNQKFTYGTNAVYSFRIAFITPQYASSSLTYPLGANSSTPTAGTINVAGTTVTLTLQDTLSIQAVANKIAATAISGWNVGVATNGYMVILTSTTIGPIAVPTVSLGTATQILFNDISFTQGLSVPAGNLDDIKVSGKTPIQVTLTNTGGAPTLQSSVGSDDEQTNGTLTYNNVTLSGGTATITTPISYLRVVAGGATQVKLYITR